MLEEKVLDIIAATRRIPRETVTLESTFEDLQIDSLDTVEIVFKLEEEFKIRVEDTDVHGISSVREAIAKLEELIAAQPAAQPAG